MALIVDTQTTTTTTDQVARTVVREHDQREHHQPRGSVEVVG
jgi:hypothetical protein